MAMKRSSPLKVIERNEAILKKIHKLKEEHPFWGYRRVWAHLSYVQNLIVNRKRVYRLMKENGLLVTKATRLKAKRTPLKSKPKAKTPNSYWGIDMTKFKTKEGWSYLVIVLDWYSKKIVGSHLSNRSKTPDWLEALEAGVMSQFKEGSRGKKLKLISDNGCQPTSRLFMETCNTLEIEQIFTSYNNPKGNADTERMMRTIKEELIWLKEWSSHDEVNKALQEWIRNYNEKYLHSTHGYRTPNWMEENYQEQKIA
jgi:putative transposase